MKPRSSAPLLELHTTDNPSSPTSLDRQRVDESLRRLAECLAFAVPSFPSIPGGSMANALAGLATTAAGLVVAVTTPAITLSASIEATALIFADLFDSFRLRAAAEATNLAACMTDCARPIVRRTMRRLRLDGDQVSVEITRSVEAGDMDPFIALHLMRLQLNAKAAKSDTDRRVRDEMNRIRLQPSPSRGTRALAREVAQGLGLPADTVRSAIGRLVPHSELRKAARWADELEKDGRQPAGKKFRPRNRQRLLQTRQEQKASASRQQVITTLRAKANELGELAKTGRMQESPDLREKQHVLWKAIKVYLETPAEPGID